MGTAAGGVGPAEVAVIEPDCSGTCSYDTPYDVRMSGTHSCLTPVGRAFWHSERLWRCAEALSVKQVAIDSIAEFDQDCWFGADVRPTCRDVAKHAQRISEADLSYPIILASDGHLMDGGHRLAKAWLLGHTLIATVQFDIDPEPDWIEARP